MGAVTTANALTDLSTLTTITDGSCTESSSKSVFPFSTTYTYSSASLDAASVSDVVTKTVALSSDTQASCVTTSRRLQSSGTTTGTLAGTIDGTCSSFSTATDYITQTLTNIAGATSVSVTTTGGCTTTTATTTDEGGWPWWAWFLLMLLICCVLFACCGLGAIPFLGRKNETVYRPPEQRPLMVTPPVTTVPMARPVTTMPMARPVSTVPMATTTVPVTTTTVPMTRPAVVPTGTVPRTAPMPYTGAPGRLF